MRVPLEWLKQFVDVTATAEEVGVKLTMGGLEVEGIESSALGPVLDVYVTPNRGDCLSMLGVAREVAALYGLELRAPTLPASPEGGPVSEQTSVMIEEPALCPRYAARLVRGIRVQPSPDWLQARLDAANVRTINNVVDVTNYVMLELGQPLHAFDLRKLGGERIVVRRAREGEELKTLDGVERNLTPAMLVIADAEQPVAVAGVMGGAGSEVSDDTTDLLIESAHFDPLSVRRTSRALGLRTEASYRFERVVDPNGVRRAVDRACELLEQIGGSAAVAGVVDVYPEPVLPRRVALRPRRASNLLGMEISTKTAEECLARLGFQTTHIEKEEALEVTIPTFRPDLTLEEDLIEEVGRIYGYENIPETLPIGGTTRGGDSEEGRLISRVKRALVECGLQEVVTHSLTAPSFFNSADDAGRRRVAVRNALSSEISGLRASLIPSMLEVVRRNVARGRHSLSLFEVGRVWRREEGEPVETISIAGLLMGSLLPPDWQQGGKSRPAGFSELKGVVEALLSALQIEGAEFLLLDPLVIQELYHPGRTAWIRLHREYVEGVVGELHPALMEDHSVRDRIYLFEIPLEALKAAMPSERPGFRPMSPYPAVTRDLAPRLSADTLYSSVEAAIRAAKVVLLEEFRLIDVYIGPPLPAGVKSLTLSLTFQSSTGTLKEAEINEALDRIRAELETHCGAGFLT